MGEKKLSKIKTIEFILKHRSLTGILLLIVLTVGYFYFFNQFWTHLDPATFKNMKEFTGSRIRGHRGRQILVHRDFYHIATRLNQYAVKNQVYLIITQSYRPPNHNLYDAIVTPAIKSNHLAGHALDFNVIYGHHLFESDEMFNDQFHKLPDAVKDFIADIQTDPGIRWGGDFDTEDPVHLDDALNINDPEKWQQHYTECVTDYVNAVPKWKSWVKRILMGL